MESPTFYLGTHQPDWLRKTAVPMMVSRRRLAKLRTLPRAKGEWVLDSGGFSELSLHGRWTVPVGQYVNEVRWYVREIGKLKWAAPMDWMCEPVMVAKTGLSVEEHQRRTLDNFLELRAAAPELPFIPVLQGWTIGDYWRHAEAYEKAGVDLANEPTVGVGSVCRRQGSARIGVLLATLADSRLRLHAFGVKARGLVMSADHVSSADSLAWSYHARRRPPLPGCEHQHCGNCLQYALRWRRKLLRLLGRDEPPPPEPVRQRLLFD